MTQGIFNNQAMGALPRGVFGNQAPASGFGSTGGIFSGPTALGIARLPEVRQRGLSGDTQANQQCKLNCMSSWADSPDSDYNTLLCQQNCDHNYPPETTLVPETPYDPGGGNQASYDASQGQPCSSSQVVRMVQMAIGAAIDGKWGPESASKLKASGQTFKAFAPGCTGAIPSYSGGGTQPYTPPPGPGTTLPPAPPAEANILGGTMDFLTSKMFGIPVAGWAAGITIVVALGLAVAKQKGAI